MRARAAGLAWLAVTLAALAGAPPAPAQRVTAAVPGGPAVAGSLAGAAVFAHDACMDRLDSLGRVTYASTGPDTGRARSGTTIFHFDQDNHYTYRFTTAPWRDSLAVTLRVQASIAIHPWHEIRLPDVAADSAARREHLLRGLHDYVAISIDERPVLLVQWLVTHLPPLTAHAGVHEQIAGPLADGVIAAALESRYRAVVDLLGAAYAHFDSLTDRGRAPLPAPQRDAFFAALYDRDALVRAHFPYLADVESVLVASRYVHARRPHCAGDR